MIKFTWIGLIVHFGEKDTTKESNMCVPFFGCQMKESIFSGAMSKASVNSGQFTSFILWVATSFFKRFPKPSGRIQEQWVEVRWSPPPSVCDSTFFPESLYPVWKLHP